MTEKKMTKNDIINELNEMGYKVKEQYVMKNGVKMLGISIIDSDRYMIPVFLPFGKYFFAWAFIVRRRCYLLSREEREVFMGYKKFFIIF